MYTYKKYFLHKFSLKILTVAVTLFFFISCSNQSIKKDFYTELWPIMFYEKYTSPNSEVVLYKVIESAFSSTDLAKINNWMNDNNSSIFFPDSLELDIFQNKNPYSPTTNFKFYVNQEDSVRFVLYNDNTIDSTINLYNGYLSRGYYLLLVQEVNIESGICSIQSDIGVRQEKKQIMFLK